MLYVIAGKFKHKKLKSPKSQETRPTTSKLREALFNICQSYVEDAIFLDVFAGSGAMGIEALSRGAQKSTFIDASRDSIHCINENLKDLGIQSQGRPLMGDVFTLLRKLETQNEKFHIVYMDPPYDVEDLPRKLIQKVDETDILIQGGMLFIEESKAALIDKNAWHTLKLKSERKMGRSQLLQFEKMSSK